MRIITASAILVSAFAVLVLAPAKEAFAAESDFDTARSFFISHGIKINADQSNNAEKPIDLAPLWRKLGISAKEIQETKTFDCEDGKSICEVKGLRVKAFQGQDLAILLIESGWNYQALFFTKGKAGYQYAGQVSKGVQKYGTEPTLRFFGGGLIGATWMRISGSGVLERVTEIYRAGTNAPRFKVLGRFTSEYTRTGWARKWGEEIETRYEVKGDRVHIEVVITLLTDSEDSLPLAKKTFKASLKIKEDGLQFLPDRSGMSQDVYNALVKVDIATNPIFEPVNRTKIYYALFKSQVDATARPDSRLKDWHDAFMEDLADATTIDQNIVL